MYPRYILPRTTCVEYRPGSFLSATLFIAIFRPKFRYIPTPTMEQCRAGTFHGLRIAAPRRLFTRGRRRATPSFHLRCIEHAFAPTVGAFKWVQDTPITVHHTPMHYILYVSRATMVHQVHRLLFIRAFLNVPDTSQENSVRTDARDVIV